MSLILYLAVESKVNPRNYYRPGAFEANRKSNFMVKCHAYSLMYSSYQKTFDSNQTSSFRSQID